jgi:hypothetical protein
MKTRLASLLAMTALMIPAVAAYADDERSYTEDTVVDVTAVRTKPGMFDTYMHWLATTYKQNMEEEKKAGIIVDYSIMLATPRKPGDPDLYLTTTFKNMAALDNLDDKTEAIFKKVWATRAIAAKAEVDREAMREILGSELLRKLTLK